MNNNERSPRFPFNTLEESLQHLEKLSTALTGESLPVDDAVQALGYAGAHGAAVKSLAALAAYDLIHKQRGVVSLTETGRRLLAGPPEEERTALLQRAALSPMAFRRIWRRARDLAEVELTGALAARGFTEQGAARASRVYHANAELASLAGLEMEPDLPERGPKRRGKFGRLEGRQFRRGEGGAPAQPPALRLPLSQGAAILPTMTEADYELLMETLKLWKDRLIGS